SSSWPPGGRPGWIPRDRRSWRSPPPRGRRPAGPGPAAGPARPARAGSDPAPPRRAAPSGCGPGPPARPGPGRTPAGRGAPAGLQRADGSPPDPPPPVPAAPPPLLLRPQFLDGAEGQAQDVDGHIPVYRGELPQVAHQPVKAGIRRRLAPGQLVQPPVEHPAQLRKDGHAHALLPLLNL